MLINEVAFTAHALPGRDTRAALLSFFTAVGVGASHGRHVRVGQIWRSNDVRRFRGVRVVGFETSPAGGVLVRAVNVVNGQATSISLDAFTVGARGWSLEKEAA